MWGWLLHLLLPFICLLPGLLLLGLSRKGVPGPISWSEVLFRSFLAGFLFHSVVLFLLAEAGLLSPFSLLVIEGSGGILLLFLVWRRRRYWHRPRLSWEDGLPLFLLVWTALLLGRPYPNLLGGADPGSYVAIATAISREGSLRLHDPLWAAMEPNWAKEEFLFANMATLQMAYHRLPGFYALDASSGTVLPQFYHLYPLWLALGLWLVGFPGGLWVTPVLACWAILSLYFAGRSLFGRWPAFLAALLWGTNALFLWMSRNPVSEVMAQFLLFGAIYGLATFLQSHEWDTVAGLLGGAALGGLLHTRLDAILAIGWAILWLALRPLGGKRHHGLPFFSLGLALAHWGFYLAAFSWGYTGDALGGSLRFLYGPLSWIVIPSGVAVLTLLLLLARKGLLPTLWPFLRLALALIVLLLVLLAWFLWPHLTPAQEVGFFSWDHWDLFPITQGQNFVQLTWYLSPLAVALGVAGFLWLLSKGQRKAFIYPAGLVLLYGAVYIYHTAEYPLHPYVMRRYFPFLLPFLVLLAVYALYRLTRLPFRPARLLAFGLLIWLTWCLWNTTPLLRNSREFAGLDDQLTDLAKRFAPGDILLFADVWPGTNLAVPLQYIYQRSSWVLQRERVDDQALRAQVGRWWAEGREVYVLVARGNSRLSPQKWAPEWEGTLRLAWEQPYPLWDRPPEQMQEIRISLDLYRLALRTEAIGPTAIDVGGADYPYLSGFWDKEVDLAGRTFRWTKGEAEVEIPGRWFDTAGPPRLLLTLSQSWANPGRPSTLRIWLEERLLIEHNPPRDWQDWTLDLPEEFWARLPKEGVVHLRLESATWMPASEGYTDERELGVALDRVLVMP